MLLFIVHNGKKLYITNLLQLTYFCTSFIKQILKLIFSKYFLLILQIRQRSLIIRIIRKKTFFIAIMHLIDRIFI